MNATLAPHDIHRLLNAEHDDPFGVLGLHKIDDFWVVRAFRPDAKELAIVDRHNAERLFPAHRIANEGLFEAPLTGLTYTPVALGVVVIVIVRVPPTGMVLYLHKTTDECTPARSPESQTRVPLRHSWPACGCCCRNRT